MIMMMVMIMIALIVKVLTIHTNNTTSSNHDYDTNATGSSSRGCISLPEGPSTLVSPRKPAVRDRATGAPAASGSTQGRGSG